MSRPTIALATALLLAAPIAQAGVGAGDIEAGLSVSLTSLTVEIDGGPEVDSDYGIVEASGGWFYDDHLEFKLGLSLVATTDATYGTINPGADWLFGPGREVTIADLKGLLVPFVGGSYGKAVGDFDETDYLEVHGGAKYFFRERTSLEAKLGYSAPMDSDFSDIIDLSVGFNVYF